MKNKQKMPCFMEPLSLHYMKKILKYNTKYTDPSLKNLTWEKTRNESKLFPDPHLKKYKRK